jgi:membrane protease YdiL (CAAX protease family)
MTLGMMLLGWMADRYGLVGPMLAHMLIDVILLERLYGTWVSLQRRVSTSTGQSLA